MDKLNTYTVEITETLQKQINVHAKNRETALQEIKERYFDEKIWLSEDDLCDTSFEIIDG